MTEGINNKDNRKYIIRRNIENIMIWVKVG
jgi:hypothetical protein